MARTANATRVHAMIPTVSAILDEVLGVSPALVSWHVRRAVMITRDLLARAAGDEGDGLRPPALDDLYAAVRAPDPAVFRRTRDGELQARRCLIDAGVRVVAEEISLAYHGPPSPYRGRADLLLSVAWPDSNDRQLVLTEVKVRERPQIYERDLLQLAAYGLAMVQAGPAPIDGLAVFLVVPPVAALIEVPVELVRTGVGTWLDVLHVYAGLRALRRACADLVVDAGSC